MSLDEAREATAEAARAAEQLADHLERLAKRMAGLVLLRSEGLVT